MSYVAISQKSLDTLCFYVDPVTAGYCPVRRLILAHAQLGSQGAQALFRALTQNVRRDTSSLSPRLENKCVLQCGKFLISRHPNPPRPS